MGVAFLVSYALLWILVLVVCTGLLICLRQMGEMYLVSSGLKGIAEDGIDHGKEAPDFDVKLANGALVKMRRLLPEGGLVIFASESCGICRKLMPEVQSNLPNAPVLVVYDGQVPRYTEPWHHGRIIGGTMADEDLPLKYRVRVTPFIFAIDSEHRVRSKGLINTIDHVRYHANQTDAGITG